MQLAFSGDLCLFLMNKIHLDMERKMCFSKYTSCAQGLQKREKPFNQVLKYVKFSFPHSGVGVVIASGIDVFKGALD